MDFIVLNSIESILLNHLEFDATKRDPHCLQLLKPSVGFTLWNAFSLLKLTQFNWGSIRGSILESLKRVLNGFYNSVFWWSLPMATAMTIIVRLTTYLIELNQTRSKTSECGKFTLVSSLTKWSCRKSCPTETGNLLISNQIRVTRIIKNDFADQRPGRTSTEWPDLHAKSPGARQPLNGSTLIAIRLLIKSAPV